MPYSIDIHEKQAKYYKWREPYVPQLFADVCSQLRVSERSHLADLGCGTGQVARQLAKYAGRVSAIDGSPEMIANATQHKRIMYQVMDLNASVPTNIGTVDHAFFGRSIHWFSLEAVQALADGILRTDGSLVVCYSSWQPNGKWGSIYTQFLRRVLKNQKSLAGVDFTGKTMLGQAGFKPLFRHSQQSTLTINRDVLAFHMLSRAYGEDLSGLEAGFDDFRRELYSALSSASADALQMRVHSYAFVYRR